MKSLMLLIAALAIFAGLGVLSPASPAYPPDKNVTLAASDFDSNIYIPPDTSGQSKYVLGVRKPDGTCYITEIYANSLDQAISSITNNCQDCTVDDITNAYMPGTPDFKNYCLAGPGT
ncbi:MAG: hypothetical protein WA666_10300 [Nitrospirota bacterium]